MKKITDISLYWKCQVIGWCVASLYWGFSGMRAPRATWLEFFLQLTGDILIGICITHGYRYVARKYRWTDLPLGKLVIRLIPTVLLLGSLFAVLTGLKLYYLHFPFWPDADWTLPLYLKTSFETLLVTGIRLMAIWVLIYHMYHYARRESKIALENARLLTATREAQLNHLSAQLNPHFFFNSLNTIKFLIKEDPNTARRAVDLLSDLLRQSLYKYEDRLITVQEELQLVNDYLELEKLRFEEHLQTNIIVGDNCLPVTLPPLSIQTLVENSIKHGISGMKEGGSVVIHLERNDDQLQVTVTNSGKLQAAPDTGIGLKNLQERLQLHYNGHATLQLTESNNMVTVVLIIPAYV
ncbi:histidine kinase [Chitinophaga dinghuensis]|uniref:Histidine kinase n=1 Tax=Chitinophaga dinghuensis TaxID=1539050 RepID=A0A327VM88_9BACT|nr:histidine kinase [Chitinophaga dinghuensis]RAJ74975.1 histidine kinase [Chitinophaga dinghuensis]